MDAIDDMKREDREEQEAEEGNSSVLTHKFEDYYADNFKKNEKG